MRIIAGEKRGMQIETLAGEDTRPTLERVKEGLFSSIHFLLPGAKVLDLFAGSGQMGLEALSRGASCCVFIDQGKEAVDMVIANAKRLGLFGRCKVARMEADAFLAHGTEQFDIVFLDPPYRQGVFPGILYRLGGRLKPGALVVCESEGGVDFPQRAGGLCLQKSYRYGTVYVHRYLQTEAVDEEPENSAVPGKL